MRAFAFLACLVLWPRPVWGGAFGEGYSSAEPGGPADIRYRAFALVTRAEVCATSARPAEFRIHPNPVLMRIGERIHRSNVDAQVSELVIEAYDENGEFLSTVPIHVSTMDLERVTDTRSDWDYMEAVEEGEDDLVVAWACASPGVGPVEARVRMMVRP